MERNIKTEAIVVGTRKLGEINRGVTLLSPNLGIIEAVIYGGQKSRKASRPPLFSIGEFYLQHSPETGRCSLADVSLISDCPFEFSLQQVGIASFMTELGRKIGEPDPARTYALLSSALLALSHSEDESRRSVVLIQFVWQLMKTAGFAADMDCCPICDKPYSEKQLLAYSASLNFFCCENCADGRRLVMGPGARKYFRLTLQMDFSQAIEVPLLESTASRLRRLMISYADEVSGHRLRTVESGML